MSLLDSITPRENTSDAWIKTEMHRDYRFLNMGVGDVALDLGAHIGYFALYALDQGVSHVFCYEPDEANFGELTRNTADHPVTRENAAIAAEDGWGTLYLSNSGDKAAHSTIDYRGREGVEVRTRSFADVLASAAPDIVKVDIEGGEYDISFAHLPDKVRGITIEFHLGRKTFREYGVPRIEAELRAKKFSPVNEVGVTRTSWNETVTWLR